MIRLFVLAWFIDFIFMHCFARLHHLSFHDWTTPSCIALLDCTFLQCFIKDCTVCHHMIRLHLLALLYETAPSSLQDKTASSCFAFLDCVTFCNHMTKVHRRSLLALHYLILYDNAKSLFLEKNAQVYNTTSFFCHCMITVTAP